MINAKKIKNESTSTVTVQTDAGTVFLEPGRVMENVQIKNEDDVRKRCKVTERLRG